MKKIEIPKYSLGEELINSISHGVGAILGIVALVLTIIYSSIHNNTLGVVASCIYGISMIIMYTISCIYHALSPKLKAKKVFRVLDHCDIYVFIAGCYTPYCISLIGGQTGWILFTVIWLAAIIGVLLNAINLEKFKIPSLIMYLVMGWMIIFSFNALNNSIERNGLYLLVSGGIAYTIGAVLYMLGSKKKYFHSIFHFFCIIRKYFTIFINLIVYTLIY